MAVTTTVNRGLAKVGSQKIAWESAGAGSPALLFIPGIFQDRSYFRKQAAHFSKRRRVVTLDLRGQGASSAAPEVSLDDFAADVIAVADDAGLDSVILCGHSMGGAVALKVAGARPELVHGVVMLDGAVLFPEAVRQAALSNLIPALATEGWMEALRGYFSNLILGPNDPPNLRQRVLTDLERARPAFARSFFASVFASDHAGNLESAPCPLLYIRAKAPADLNRLQELRPDALVGQVVGSGHYAMLTASDQVNAMLDRFLEVVENPRT